MCTDGIIKASNIYIMWQNLNNSTTAWGSLGLYKMWFTTNFNLCCPIWAFIITQHPDTKTQDFTTRISLNETWAFRNPGSLLIQFTVWPVTDTSTLMLFTYCGNTGMFMSDFLKCLPATLSNVKHQILLRSVPCFCVSHVTMLSAFAVRLLYYCFCQYFIGNFGNLYCVVFEN